MRTEKRIKIISKDVENLEQQYTRKPFDPGAEFENGWFEGFDTGDFSQWSGRNNGNQSVITEAAYRGDYGMRESYSGVSDSAIWKDFTASTIVMVEFMLRPLTFTPPDPRGTYHRLIYELDSISFVVCKVDVENDYLRIGYRKDGTTVWENISYDFSYNIWYKIKMEVKIGAGNGHAKWWINDVRVVFKTDIDNTYSDHLCDRLYISSISGAGDGSWEVDRDSIFLYWDG